MVSPPPQERVILVDEQDTPKGTMEKLEAHRTGLLHRAFSIFLFDATGRTLLQRRALTKYHSGGLWSNTCCGHPRPDETVTAAGHRRLMEEMGISCHLHPGFSFVYRAELANGLIEHELDHVLFGHFDRPPTPAPEEADAWRYASLAELDREVQESPQAFTAWFRICLPRVIAQRAGQPGGLRR